MSDAFWAEMEGQQQGNSCEVYEFTRTDHMSYYTSYHEAVTINFLTYPPATLKRSTISSVWHARERVCTVTGTTDPDGAFAFLLDTIPDTRVIVRIYRAFIPSENSQLIFFGYMQSYSVKKSVAVVKFESINYMTRYKIPRMRIQSYCNHRLFDDNCTLDKIAYRIGGIIIDTSGDPSVASNQIVVQGSYNDDFGESLADKAAAYFTVGVAFYNSHYRYISKSEDYAMAGLQKKLTLQLGFPSGAVGVGTQLDLWPGCDKSPLTCETKFDNLDHFLGFPYVPSDQQSGDLTVVE